MTDRKFLALMAGELDYLPLQERITSVTCGLAFNTGLASVDLPVCRSLGPYALYHCSGIQSLGLPVCESVGERALNGLTSLKSLEMPSCRAVGAYYAVSSCTSLSTASFPRLPKAPYTMFSYDSRLETVYFDSLTVLGDVCFESCTSLRYVYCPNLAALESRTFGYLGGLKQDLTLDCSARTTAQVLAMSLKDHFGNTPKSAWAKFRFVCSDGSVGYDADADAWRAD